MEHLYRSQSLTLTVGDDVVGPSQWIAYPGRVSLAVSADKRSCVVTPLPEGPQGVGSCTVKVLDRAAQGVAYFALSIEEDAPGASSPSPASSLAGLPASNAGETAPRSASPG